MAESVFLGREEAGDRGVVVGGVGEDLGRKLAAHLGREPVRAEQLEHLRIVGGVHDRQHELVILGGGAEHRGAADVDVLYRIVERHAGPGNGHLERVQVHGDEVDRHDAVLLHGGQMLGPVPSRE
jgi:hypothetical protein